MSPALAGKFFAASITWKVQGIGSLGSLGRRVRHNCINLHAHYTDLLYPQVLQVKQGGLERGSDSQ